VFTWVGTDYHENVNTFYWSACAIVTLVQIIPSFIYVISFIKPVSVLLHYVGMKLTVLESGIYLGSITGFAIDLIMRTYNGQCEENSAFFEVWGCNPAQELNLLPQDSSLLVILTPFVLSGKSVHWFLLLSVLIHAVFM
jgi:hypothetical protein